MADKFYVVREGTMRKLQRVIGDADSPEPGKNAPRIGRQTVLVKATSTTPAANTTLGNQCYPAELLNPLSSSDGTPDVLSSVWLTVLGEDATPVEPVANQTYLGLMAGSLEIANVTRPRVFAIEGDGAGDSVLKITGAAVSGAYPATVETLHGGNLTWTSGNTTIYIQGINGETLANGTRYLGCLANGSGNGTFGNAAIYAVTPIGSGSREAFLGNVVTAGNLGNAGNVACLTLNANGCVSNGTGNLSFSFDVANTTYPTTQRLGLLTVGSSNVAIPVTPADGTGNHGWVSNTTQTFVGPKTFRNDVTVAAANTTTTRANITISNGTLSLGDMTGFGGVVQNDIRANGGIVCTNGFGVLATDDHLTRWGIDSGASTTKVVRMYLIPNGINTLQMYGRAGATNEGIYFDCNGVGGRVAVASNTVFSFVDGDPAFGGTVYDGVTADVVIGATTHHFKGGIYVGAASPPSPPSPPPPGPPPPPPPP